MYKAYLITYNGRPHRVYQDKRGAKIALGHFLHYYRYAVRVRNDRPSYISDDGYERLGKVLADGPRYELVEIGGEKSVSDVTFQELAARIGAQKTGLQLVPIMSMQRELIDLQDTLLTIYATKQVSPAQQKFVNDKLAEVAKGYARLLLELGADPTSIINYAGGKLS